MAIRASEPPITALSALRSGLGQIRGGPAPADLHGMSLAPSPGADGREGSPHQVFTLALNAIVEGRGLDAAEQVGWRYLVGGTAEHPAVAAEVHRGEAEDHRFAGLNHGPFVGQLMQMIQSVEAQPEIRDGDFEPRLLRVPALYVAALWLKDRRSGRDIVIPLEHSAAGVQPGQSYSAAEFMAALNAMAAKRQAPPEIDRGPSAP